MKVLDLKVKNFAPIMVAMKKSELAIDFRKGENLLTLLVGGNGTGKTTICSLLHPFAYNGDIDNRDNDIIIKDSSGYKSITIQYNDDIFYIEHFYKRNNDGSISVKSYIKRNDEELNENGNVTSFKSIVQNYLGIDESYLKLTRLGANVVNIINMTSAERKEFMNKRLEELNKYGALYKKTSEDLRIIKALLKINVTNMNKLNITNISLYEEEINTAKKHLESIIKDKDSILSSMNITKGKLDILSEGNSDIENEYRTLINNRRDLMSIKERLEAIVGSIDKSSIDMNSIFDKYKKASDVFNKDMSALNELYTKRASIDALMSSYQSITYLEDLRNRKDSIEKEIAKHIKIYGEDKPNIPSSEEYKEVLSTLQVMDNMCYTLYSISITNIQKIMKDSNGNLGYYLRQLQTRLADEYNRDNRKELKALIDKNINSLYIMVEPNCGYERCSYRKFYQDMMDFNTKEVKEDKDDIDQLISDTETLIGFYTMVKKSAPILSKIPNDELGFDNMLSRVCKGLPIYDENDITEYIDLASEWENYMFNLKRLTDIEEELSKFKGTDEIDQLVISKSSIEASIIKMEAKRDKSKTNLLEIEKEQQHILSLQNQIKEYEDTIDKLNSIEDSIKNMRDTISKIGGYRDELTKLGEKLTPLSFNERILNEKVEQGKFNIEEYYRLDKERKKLDKDFEDWSDVVDSVAAKKGIPLEFINYYLEGIRVLTNDCLRVVYGDNLYISKMHADEKTFDIIYVKDGLTAGDIRSASQGESSFINIAISFAFLASDLKDYNIILLDEVDGVLDADKRIKFIDILYDRLNSMRCEQCFLISHNEIYNNENIDIILTDDSDTGRFRNSNIIFQR